MTHPTPARPCSSPARPNTGDDLTQGWSSLVPHPTGTTTTGTSTDDHTETTSSSHRYGTSRRIIGPLSEHAWHALLDRLTDGDWHPTHEALDIMQGAGLARRTVQNYLASAGRRGWIRRQRGMIKLRDRHALEAALEEAARRG